MAETEIRRSDPSAPAAVPESEAFDCRLAPMAGNFERMGFEDDFKIIESSQRISSTRQRNVASPRQESKPYDPLPSTPLSTPRKQPARKDAIITRRNFLPVAIFLGTVFIYLINIQFVSRRMSNPDTHSNVPNAGSMAQPVPKPHSLKKRVHHAANINENRKGSQRIQKFEFATDNTTTATGQGASEMNKREFSENTDSTSRSKSIAPQNSKFTMTTQAVDKIQSEPKDFGGVLSRPFERWPSSDPLPCFDPNEVPGMHWTSKKVQRRPTTEGLFYIKLVKTGSSTTSGVHLRLARSLAHRLQQESHNATNYEICRSRFLHGWAGRKMLDLGRRNRTQSFLWTILREPTKRYVSDFFHFQVSRRNVPPTASNVKAYFDTYKHKHHYIDWLSTTGYKYTISNPFKKANRIVADFNFLGVVERLDESLVVLALLLDIPLGDILYLDSKRSGGYDDGAHNKRCTFIQPTNVTPEIQSYLSSKEWRDYIEPEERLFQAANHSLELTIMELGRELVAQKLNTFRKAQAVVQARCLNSTRFPCSSTGDLRNISDVDCLTRDLGCGFDCLDEVARDLGIAS